MIKTITFIGFLLLAVSFNANANAHDSDRIELLEKEIQEINIRLSKLEYLLSNPSKTEEHVKSSEGWKLVMNWRKLTTGMSTSDVQNILGEPHRVVGGLFAFWYYQNDGNVSFRDGKVFQWEEPRQ